MSTPLPTFEPFPGNPPPRYKHLPTNATELPFRIWWQRQRKDGTFSMVAHRNGIIYRINVNPFPPHDWAVEKTGHFYRMVLTYDLQVEGLPSRR